jgi:PAS domain S-box-containing protein
LGTSFNPLPDEPDSGRFALLAAVAEVADGSLPFEQTVTRLLEIVVPAFADMALLDAVGRDDRLRRLGARVHGPNGGRLEDAVLRRRRVVAAPVGVARVLARGASHLLSPVTEEHLRAIASSDEDLELLRSLELRSALFVPLRARGRIIGALACGVGSSGRHYQPEDVRFAEVLAGRISLALDNAGLSQMVGELERQLESTLDNLAEAVLVRDPAGRLVFANAAVVSLLGFNSLDEMESATSDQLMELFDAFDEEGRRLGLSDLPSARAMRGEPAEPLLVRNVVRQTGAERWLLHKATPVFDPNGKLSLVVNVIEDLTEVKRAELAQRLLAEAGKELSSSLDLEQTLNRVAALAVPQLADWCGVRILGPHDELEQVAVAHVDPEKVALAREFGRRYPTRLTDPAGTAEVVRSGRPQLIREITAQMVDEADVSEEQKAIVHDLQMRSLIIVPLAMPGRSPLGAMTLVMAESGRLFDERDLELAEELGRRAATAVENARLYTERSRIASTLQESLLPEELPEIAGFRLASLYRAAGERSEVGGDFYDAFAIPSGWVVLVGDVTGRGPEAAALTSLSRYTMRTAARLLDDPLRAIEQLNDELRERPKPSLVTIGCALLYEAPEGPQARIILAGHPQPFHVQRGAARQIGRFGPPLGAYESGGWQAETITLEPGDQLILYTDGVTDTVGHDERFGEERLARVLADAVGAAEAVQRIDQALRDFAQGPQADDTAVLAVERGSQTIV